MPTIAILGTFDTKGVEHAFVAEYLRTQGHQVILINVGSLAEPAIQPDVTTLEVAAAGGEGWQQVLERQDRGECVAFMGKAAANYLAPLVAAGKLHGVVSLGGGGGTAIATAAMRALPIGFPKVMVSTLAGGNVAPYVGTTDIVMIPAIVDVSGVNRISEVIFSNAAAAVGGMATAYAERKPQAAASKPLIAASMFGNTTACVEAARKILEGEGYEVLVFHATGTGGRMMETLISSGMIDAVLDITTTEWADELVGGILSAGPARLDAAADQGIPTIIVPGCLDMVNFGEPQTIASRFEGRTFYHHNPQNTLMRTTPAESAQLGKIIAEKANRYRQGVSVLVPKIAISVISAPGQAFYDPAADVALFEAIKKNLTSSVELLEYDLEINDPTFARACADALLKRIAIAG